MIESSRQQQMSKRRAEKEADVNEQKEFAEFWRMRNDELAIAEAQEKEEERLRAVELARNLQE